MSGGENAAKHLADGKRAYAEGNLSAAKRHMHLALLGCSDCPKKALNQLCKCHDLLGAVKNKSLQDELKKQCRCEALGNRRCRQANHLDALHALVQIAVKENKPDRALQYALKLVSLAPRSSKSYLRLGKVLRATGKSETAFSVYQEGTILARPNDSPDFQTLLYQKDQLTKFLAKTDPLEVLSVELVDKILESLDIRSLCRALRVSKAWMKIIKGSTPAWIHQHYQHPTWGLKRSFTPASSVSLSNIQSYMGHHAGGRLRALVIDDCARFDLRQHKLVAILTLCPQLKELTLNASQVVELPDALPANKKLNTLRLESIHLGHMLRPSRAFLRDLLRLSSATLRDLSVFGFPGLHDSGSWPLLPGLQALALSGVEEETYIDMYDVHEKTPNLRSLWAEDLHFNGGLGKQTLPGHWVGLQRICIGEGVKIGPHVFRPYLGKQMTEISLSGDSWVHMLLPNQVSWPRLRKIAIKGWGCIHEDQLAPLLREAIDNDTLEEIELSPVCPRLFLDGFSGKQEKVRFFGFGGLAVVPCSIIDSPDDTLLQMLDHFPDCEILDIGQEQIKDSTLAMCIARRGIKTIYHRRGAILSDLREWALTRGAEVICTGAPYPLNASRHPDSRFKRKQRRLQADLIA